MSEEPTRLSETQVRNIVKYQNRLNMIPLRHFTRNEMDIFFAIAAQVRDRGVDEITLSFKQLHDLVNYKRDKRRFVLDIETTYTKILKLGVRFDDGDIITKFNLFDMYQINRKKEYVTVAVNRRFKSLFNDLDQWTVFGLESFTELNSTYSKTMFRLIKQFRTTGYRRFSMEEFRMYMDVPESYKAQHIISRVVQPINDELPKVIPGFHLHAIREAELHGKTKDIPKRGRGASVVAFKATCTPEKVQVIDERVVRDADTKQIADLSNRKQVKEVLPDWALDDQYNPKGPVNHDSTGDLNRIEQLKEQLKTQQDELSD